MATATMKFEGLLKECSNLPKEQIFSLLAGFKKNKAFRIVDKICHSLLKTDHLDSRFEVLKTYYDLKDHDKFCDSLEKCELSKFTTSQAKTLESYILEFFDNSNDHRSKDFLLESLEKLNLNQSRVALIKASKYFERLEYKKAYNSYLKYEQKLDSLSKCYFAISMAYTGQTSRAKALLKEVYESDIYDSFKSVVLVYFCEVYVLEKKYNKALKFLEKSFQLKSSQAVLSSHTAHAYSLYAFICAKLGLEDDARRYFELAQKAYQKDTFSIHHFAKLSYFKSQVNLASTKELNSILFHPEVSMYVKNSMFLTDLQKDIFFGSKQKAKLKIYPNSNECSFLSQNYYELGYMTKALATLKTAGLLGISIETMRQVSSDKIEEAIRDIHKIFKLDIILNNDRYYLLDPNSFVYVEYQRKSKSSFLEIHNSFNFEQLRSYYKLSPSKTDELIEKWIEKSWIKRLESDKTFAVI